MSRKQSVILLCFSIFYFLLIKDIINKINFLYYIFTIILRELLLSEKIRINLLFPKDFKELVLCPFDEN
jgi:hypothetical protein